MGFDSVMASEARRLGAAVESARPEWDPSGASQQAIEELQAALAPLVLPDEVLALLEVIGGGEPDGSWVLISQTGPLLSPEQLLTETRFREKISNENEAAWSPSWVVVTSQGWDFAAIIATNTRTRRSPVMDLSYGNQANPVVSASLTSLVAASADAWEAGIHVDQLDPAGDAEAQRSQNVAAFAEHRRLLAKRDLDYPSGNGLGQGDAVAPFRQAWPATWLGRDGEDALAQHFSAESLVEALATPGAAPWVAATVLDKQDRSIRVRDSTTETWLDLPPGLEAGRDVSIGASIVACVQHRHNPGPPNPAERAMYITGLIEVRH